MPEFNVSEKVGAVKEEAKTLTQQIKHQILGYMVAALGLVAGIAWNDAIKATIEYFLPSNKNSLFARFLYAIAVTFVVVLLTAYLVRIFKGQEEKNKDQLADEEKQ